MKSNQKVSESKRPYMLHIFGQAMTFRIPLLVTKVIVYSDHTAYPLCPRCTIGLEREYMNFCDRCGQKLSWKLFAYAKIIRPKSQRK